MEQHYKFNKWDFDDNGTNTKDGSFFLELIGEWERDFHDKYSPFFSNYLFSNASTMILVKNCLVLEPDDDCGMELINGKVDLDTNLTIDGHSKRQTIYALGSRLDEDEPMFLIIDESMIDGTVILKYIPDIDNEDVGEDIPVPSERTKVKLF